MRRTACLESRNTALVLQGDIGCLIVCPSLLYISYSFQTSLRGRPSHSNRKLTRWVVLCSIYPTSWPPNAIFSSNILATLFPCCFVPIYKQSKHVVVLLGNGVRPLVDRLKPPQLLAGSTPPIHTTKTTRFSVIWSNMHRRCLSCPGHATANGSHSFVGLLGATPVTLLILDKVRCFLYASTT
ncbi:hypothetical protein K469DRAFT_121600 [Zopfia rhizophila CBS 207.26]|uniref:Uncharacterized protein n=1 Tax=Zopfia rhizophila CBS 207.26 TaxID=1314779 RepID=A0A6A6E8V4_9PEZI|nr:hypothetical protein K469DRAFT_121600 [Zopfia rhizophila CBS 207.26]